jgi:UDP-N-acetylglucosamine 1-carboxyvinyltransferase
MKKIIIEGPQELSGIMKLQGSKNAAMKHLFIPLLTKGRFVINNVPDIGSIRNIISILRKLGARVSCESKNKIEIDSTAIKSAEIVSSKDFFYTSAGPLLIPILVSRFNQWTIEKPKGNRELGGDQIGRSLDYVYEILKICGIETDINDSRINFRKISDKPFNRTIPQQWFMNTMILTLAALFKNGTSEIRNYIRVPEFKDFLRFLKKSGADIEVKDDVLKVTGPCKLEGISYTNMSDRNDLVTWVAAALATNSEIEIANLNSKKMALEPLINILQQMEANFELSNSKLIISKHNWELKPVDILAESYPKFCTDWQPLFAPVLMQVTGTSSIVEARFPKRLGYWQDLAKFGAEYKYFEHPDYPEKDNHPRAVKILGKNHNEFVGANVTTKNVRAGAAMVIAALASSGMSVIVDREGHIERGYENLLLQL